MKIKVCGLREPDNIAAVGALPVDYLGFIFYPKSPRYVGKKDHLATWLKRHPDAVANQQRVGVFVNSEIDIILNAVHDYGLDYVQLHGNESPAYCGELQTLWSVSSVESARLIKVFHVDEEFDFSTTDPYAAFCPLFLFDTRSGEGSGGTGRKFDWTILDQYQGATPFLLSGGIGPDDSTVVQKINHPQLHGIDINSRFETEPGVKDVDAIATFVKTLEANA